MSIKLNKKLILSIFILSTWTPFVLGLTQEWMFWPSDKNGKLKVNSAENISKIKNANKAETVNMRYAITTEIESFKLLDISEDISSIDLTYYSKEMLEQDQKMDRDFVPLFGTYETGLHLALTTKKDIIDKFEIMQLESSICDFINELFNTSGSTICKKNDYELYSDFTRMGTVTPHHFYMFIPDFNLDNLEGYSLYHIFNLNQRTSELNLSCQFEDDVITNWTSKYFNIVISLQSNMLYENDIPTKDDDEKADTLMIKFEEIIHLELPETISCNVNQDLSRVDVITEAKKNENNGYSIESINPRGKQNDEIVYLPCPLPKVSFDYKLNPGVGLHPVLFASFEVQDWTETQPLVMLLTLNPMIFADEYQMATHPFPKGVKVVIIGHPDLEVPVTHPQAKYNFVKIIVENVTPFSRVDLEIPLHLRYPESEPVSNKNEDKKEKMDKLYKQIFIHPPRFFTTSTKICHQRTYCGSNLPIFLLSNIEKSDMNKNSGLVMVVPMKVTHGHFYQVTATENNNSQMNEKEEVKIDEKEGIKEEEGDDEHHDDSSSQDNKNYDGETQQPILKEGKPRDSKEKKDAGNDTSSNDDDKTTKITSVKNSNPVIDRIQPLRMDVPKGQLDHYSWISSITTIVTGISIVFLIYLLNKYYMTPSSIIDKRNKNKRKTASINNIKKKVNKAN